MMDMDAMVDGHIRATEPQHGVTVWGGGLNSFSRPCSSQSRLCYSALPWMYFILKVPRLTDLKKTKTKKTTWTLGWRHEDTYGVGFSTAVKTCSSNH